MAYILFVIATIALIILYKFFPTKKNFAGFCVLLIVIFGVSAFIQHKKAEQEIITREQIEIIREQQKVFGEWYANYQKDIDQLDRNWQIYYDIVNTLKTAEIYEYTTYERLKELEWLAIDEQVRIYNLEVPKELDDETHILVSAVINKTKIYSDAQVKIITLVCAMANPEGVEDFNLADLNSKIKDITIRESPAGLFTAAEISAIRDRLTVPGEGVQDEL